MFIKLVLTVLIIVGALFLGHSYSLETKVKEGKLILNCQFHDESRDVSPNLVNYELNGTWVFTNGSASNCNTRKP